MIDGGKTEIINPISKDSSFDIEKWIEPDESRKIDNNKEFSVDDWVGAMKIEDIMKTTIHEPTFEEKIDKQNKAIDSVESGERTLETTQEKGNYGEMKTDQDLREKGYERISKDMVTDLDDEGHQGIDGVYYKPDGNPQYIIVDAKFSSAKLSETADGTKQMSEDWIDKRLDKAVGKDKADEIRIEKLLNSDNVGAYVAHVSEKGTVSYDRVDANANVIEKDVKL